MQITCRFCFLLVVWSILELYRFLGLFVMEYSALCSKILTQNIDFGCEFLVLEIFSQVFVLFGLFFMLGLGLKLLKLSYWLPRGPNLMQILCHFRGKTIDLRDGFSLKRQRFKARDQNMVSSKCSAHKLSGNYSCSNNVNTTNNVEEYEEDENEGEDQYCCNEDEEFNVMALRKLVKIERKRAKKAQKELEKERMAAASAAEEAMAVILRLQGEKSSVEMEASQYRRMVEHKQEYDDEMIKYLQWIVTKHESERSLLEDELRFCKEKLKLFTKGDGELLMDQLCEEVSMSCAIEENHNSVDELLISPPDVDCN